MILKNQENNKILRNLSGDILSNSGTSTKILHIDTDLQAVNRIHKDDTNKVSQITDKAQNIAFTVNGTEKATYNYGNYYEFNSNGAYTSVNGGKNSLSQDFTFEFIYEKTSFTAIKVLMQKGTGSPVDREFSAYFDTSETFRILLYSDVSTFSNLFIDNLSTSGLHHLAIQKNGTTVTYFLDGVWKKTQILSTAVVYNNNLEYSLGYSVGFAGFRYDGLLKSLNIWDGDIYDIAGFSINDQVFTPKQPFTYYKRYANKDGAKKIHLTSRNLENADIDSSDEITSVKDEITDELVLSGVGKPVLSNNSFRTLTGSSGLRSSNLPKLSLGIEDWTFSIWIKPTSTAIGVIFGEEGNTIFAPLIISGNVNLYLGDGNSWLHTLNTGVPVNTTDWVYLTYIRMGGVIYIFKNGKLIYVNSSITTFSIIDFQGDICRWVTNQGYQGYFNDVLFSTNAEIDPTGYSIGDKVFQPPIRRGLDSEFKIFPIP